MSAPLRFRIPEAFEPMLSSARYKVYRSGRGAAKSWTYAALLIMLAYTKKLRILCTREYQNSLEDSVCKLLSDTIERFCLGNFFNQTRASSVGLNGSEFLFEGLHRNTNAIRSIEGIDICWVAEARVVSEESWQVLIPTIRKDGSEIWIDFNPEDESDPVYRRFVLNPPPDAVVRSVTWRDNPWFPEVLRKEKDRDAALDQDLYRHIWEGEPRKISASQIFNGKWGIEQFDTPPDAVFYCGADWGFANDPLAIVRCFIIGRKLYIDQEDGGPGIEIDDIGKHLDKVLPAKRWPTRGDRSRPETISYLNRQGYDIKAALAPPGMIEDGIAFLRGFEKIIVHPRCKKIAEELRLYSYKINAITNEVLPIIIDAHNHYIDALRYAVEPLVRINQSKAVSLWS